MSPSKLRQDSPAAYHSSCRALMEAVISFIFSAMKASSPSICISCLVWCLQCNVQPNDKVARPGGTPVLRSISCYSEIHHRQSQHTSRGDSYSSFWDSCLFLTPSNQSEWHVPTTPLSKRLAAPGRSCDVDCSQRNQLRYLPVSITHCIRGDCLGGPIAQVLVYRDSSLKPFFSRTKQQVEKVNT